MIAVFILIAGLIMDALPHAGRTIGEVGTICVITGGTLLGVSLIFALAAVAAIAATGTRK